MTHLHKQFHKHFRIERVNNPQTLAESLRLRYQVYCREKNFEDPDNFPDGMERDSFDVRSDHSVIRHIETMQVMGSVRLVLHDRNYQASFPIERHIALDRLKKIFTYLPDRARIGEVSRFAISSEMRKSMEGACNVRQFLYSNTVVGLISAVVRMSLDHNLTHWVCLMEPSLARLLSRFGFQFKPFGPAVDINGFRKPYYAVIEEEMDRLYSEFPEIWDMVTEFGHFCPQFRTHKSLINIA